MKTESIVLICLCFVFGIVTGIRIGLAIYPVPKQQTTVRLDRLETESGTKVFVSYRSNRIYDGDTYSIIYGGDTISRGVVVNADWQ